MHHIPTLLVLGYPSILTNYDGAIIGHILFYLCGLPGGIDYALLFCVRNEFIDRLIEKKLNKYLHTWIRCPGAIFSSILVIIHSQHSDGHIYYIGAILTSLFTFMNGIYYMDRVANNYTYEYMLKQTKYM